MSNLLLDRHASVVPVDIHDGDVFSGVPPQGGGQRLGVALADDENPALHFVSGIILKLKLAITGYQAFQNPQRV